MLKVADFLAQFDEAEQLELLNNSSGAIYDVLAQQGQQPVMRGRLVLNQPQA